MAKKDELGEKTLNTALEKAVLNKLGDEKKFNADVENLRTALANLGLKIIEEINQKRVQKPEDSYNALVAIYNAIK